MAPPAGTLLLPRRGGRYDLPSVSGQSSQTGLVSDRGKGCFVASASGIRFEGTAFWVRHRHQEYGPFDYEWARDLSGIELLYGRSKFGEYCSEDEVCADLREFRLPMRVVEVTSIVCGTIIVGILSGMEADDRYALVRRHLNDRGLQRFAENIEGWNE